MRHIPGLPYWRLSSFYFFYFAVLGVLVPYWGLYLQAMEFSLLEIGYLSGLVMATKIFAPSIWGWLADRSGQRLRVVRWGSLAAFLCFFGVFEQRDFAYLAVVVFFYTFFWNAVLAQFEVIALGYLGDQPQWYSRLRLWGSVGFILAVIALGWVFDLVSVVNLPWFLLVFLAAIWLSSLTIHPQQQRHHHEESSEGLGAILCRPQVLAFFACCFLLQLGHGPYYTFYSIFLEARGYSRGVIGLLWALGVLAEVVVFWYMHRLLPRFGVRLLLLWSLLLAALRWTVIGFGVESLTLLLFAQLLHAFTFGVFHSVSIETVRRNFPRGHQGQGQALYSGLSFGLGGAVGAVLSGALWETLGAAWVFLCAAGAALLAWLIAWRWFVMTEKHRVPETRTSSC